MEFKNIKLDPFQRKAMAALERGATVVVAAPTGAGKTLIAEYALEKALRDHRRVIYTAPIKAISNQKFRDFGRDYGNDVGIMTGDVTINPGAPVLIMTTEIFRNTIFEDVSRLDGVGTVIFDEVHYMDDIERGTVWEESMIFAPKEIRFLCLSATISNLDDVAAWMRRVRQCEVEVIIEEGRPVPLRHVLWQEGHGEATLKEYKQARADYEARLKDERRRRRRGPPPPRRRKRRRARSDPDLIEFVRMQDQLPCILFAFSRRECEELADVYADQDLLDDAERAEMERRFDEVAGVFDIAEDDRAISMRRLLRHGVAFHHAGMLPTLKEVVERLFSSGLVKLLFATETFAMGVNMPARSVVFQGLEKFDGVRRGYMKSREYHQMAGRAGRRGIDDAGFVYARVDPEIDRWRSVRGVIEGRIEPIRSQFGLSYTTLLKLHERLGDKLIEACEQSFGNYQASHTSEHEFAGMVAQVRRRLELLRRMGYIRGPELTEKGVMASSIYGYEMHVTEMFQQGWFHWLSPDEINVLLCGAVFESKRHIWYAETDVLSKVRRQFSREIQQIRRTEKRLEIIDRLKLPDFEIAAAAWAWSTGCEFDELEKLAEASPGDLVRCFRMAIQLLRQLFKILPADDGARETISKAIDKLNRDEVDAERQLRVGAGLDDEDGPEDEGDDGLEDDPFTAGILEAGS